MSFPYVWQSWSLLALIQGGWHLHSGCEQLCGLIIHVPKGRGEGVHFYTDLIKAQEGWAPKNWCFWTVVLEKTLDGPLDSKETKPVHPKGNQPWIFIGRTDAEAEVPVVGQLIRKDLDAGKDWGHEEKGWQKKRWLDGITDWMDMTEQTPGDGEGQGSLTYCSPWGHKELDMTEQLKNNNKSNPASFSLKPLGSCHNSV